MCGPSPEITDALTLSIEIALLSTAVATVLGTLIAFAIGRHSFRGRTGINLVIFMPMATPEVVMGSSLLTLFVAAGFEGSLGCGTITIAHIMFCISFVVVTVKARIAGLDPRLEQAAMDLYADEKTTFRKVTFPLVLPGIVAGALLAFSLSFDDFVITNFTSGQTVTLPDVRLGRGRARHPARGERRRGHHVRHRSHRGAGSRDPRASAQGTNTGPRRDPRLGAVSSPRAIRRRPYFAAR